MHNPFALFTSQVLTALRKAGHCYFVRQSYVRGMDHFNTEVKSSYLISHYKDISHATIHWQALANDRARFLYDLSNKEHVQKLENAARQPTGYSIFSTLLQEKTWRPPPEMKPKIKNYIGKHLDWKPGREDSIETKLFLQFGELFVTLKYQVHEIKIPLSDIEKIRV